MSYQTILYATDGPIARVTLEEARNEPTRSSR